jgi:hypothetical protein
VRQRPIPKTGKPGEYRMLGIPTIFDRVCQQALLNRLEPIFGAPGKAWCFQRVKIPHRKGESHPTGNLALGSWR